MLSVCVLLLVGLLPACQASCSPRALPEDACSVYQSLEVFSEPKGLPVNKENCNIVYDKEEFQSQPRVKFSDAVPGQTYTLLMLDPDAPNRTLGQYYLHWIRANIQGEDLHRGDIEDSTEITTYLGPAPPAGSGLHRYMYLLYRHQQPCSRVTQPVGDPERQYFCARRWLGRMAHMGVRLCGPIAGTQFRAEFGSPSGVVKWTNQVLFN